MEYVTIKHHNGESNQYYWINGDGALENFFEIRTNMIKNIVSMLMTTKIPMEKWDHIHINNVGGSALTLSVMRSKIFGDNPLLDLAKSILPTNELVVNLKNAVSSGRIVLINKKGGYQYFDESTCEILAFSDSFDEDIIKIPENSKYLVLENDMLLDETAKEYLNSINCNPTIITELRTYPMLKLAETLKKWIKQGGETVYAYTTAIDTQQLFNLMDKFEDYFLSGEIKTLEIQFSSTPSNEVMENIRNHPIKPKIVGG